MKLYYKLNETEGASVADSSGSGFTGTATDVLWVPGKLNNAGSFNGTSSKIVSPYQGVLGGNFRTIMAWVMFLSPGLQDIVSYGARNQAYGLIQLLRGAANTLVLGVSGGSLTGTTTLYDDVWYHVAWVMGSTTLSETKLYVNGAIDPATGGSATINTVSNHPVTLGYNPAFARYGNVVFDNLRIFDSALTAGQVGADDNGQIGTELAQPWRNKYRQIYQNVLAGAA